MSITYYVCDVVRWDEPIEAATRADAMAEAARLVRDDPMAWNIHVEDIFTTITLTVWAADDATDCLTTTIDVRA